MSEFACKSKILLKDGAWMVPPEQRPRGWEGMGLAEPIQTTKENLAVQVTESTPKKSLEVQPSEAEVAEAVGQVAEATEAQVSPAGEVYENTVQLNCGCGKPLKHKGMCVTRAALASQTRENNRRALVGWEELKTAVVESARGFGAEGGVLMAGLVMCAGMWTRDRGTIGAMVGSSVCDVRRIVSMLELLGIWTTDRMAVGLGDFDSYQDLDFWLRAMAVNGDIFMGLDKNSEVVFSARPIGINA